MADPEIEYLHIPKHFTAPQTSSEYIYHWVLSTHLIILVTNEPATELHSQTQVLRVDSCLDFHRQTGVHIVFRMSSGLVQCGIYHRQYTKLGTVLLGSTATEVQGGYCSF